MYSKKMFQVITASVIMSLSFSACVKKRKDMKTPQDIEFSKITRTAPTLDKQWIMQASGKAYRKSTGKIISTSNTLFKSQNSIAENLVVEPESGLKFLNVVNFKSDYPLLNDKAEIAYLLGEENKQYPIVEELTPTHLILYKSVTDEELGFNEQTFAVRDGSRWLVPVGGFPVAYFKKQKAKNEDNRDTNVFQYVTVPAEDFQTATDYRIDATAFIPFDRFVKSDVLPKSFFNGEWYYSETTVAVNYDKGSAVGDLGGSDSNFSSATRVRFKIYDDQIIAQNTNIDPDFKNDEHSLDYGTVLKIGIEHRDFRWVPQGPTALKEIEEDTKKKDTKRFIKLDYLTSDTPQLTFESLFASLFGRVNNFRVVLEVNYGKDYFSYVIRDGQTQTIKRYSMLKVDDSKKIQPRRAFIEDNQIFGTFITEKRKKIDYKLATKEDEDRLKIMARHNPKKNIVYYFTEQTPCEKQETCKTGKVDPMGKWYRDIGRESINLWAQAFQKAGLPITIELREEKDVALGDIRYNVLNIVKRAGAGLLGFGPSLIDSETGEIVSASMNTGVDNILEQNYRVVRNYMSRRSGRYYNFKDYDGNTTLPAVFDTFAKINARLYFPDVNTGKLMLDGKDRLDPALFTDDEKKFMREFDIQPNEEISSLVKKVMELRVHSYKYANLGQLFSVSLFNTDDFTSTMVLDEVIDKNCPAVTALANRMKTELVDTVEEIRIIDPCVRLLAQGEAVLTTVHELGHNLSLRHNFKGSVDKANFPDTKDSSGTPFSYKLKYIKIAEGAARPMTSSIMEYVTDEGQQVMPGLYDIAAIRWIYGESVETKNGAIKKVNTEKPMTLSVPMKELKPFMFCTDEHRILITDPMCNSFDQGTTVKASLRFQIEQVYNALGTTYRYDRRGPGLPVLSLLVHGMSMKAKYDKWRGFLRKFTGSNKSYLQGYNVQSYAELMKKIRSNPKDAAELDEHLEVRNMLVRFLVDLAFISNKYCVVVDNDNQEKLIELEKIRREIFGSVATDGNFPVIESCQSPAASSYITDRGFKFQREFGHYLDQGQFNLDPSRRLEPLDFSGTASVRQMAMAFMTFRLAPSINNIIEGFHPSMLDEPDIRQYVQTLILDRIVNGVRVAGANSKSEYAKPKKDLFGSEDIKKIFDTKVFSNFNNEAELVQMFTSVMDGNLPIPGAPDDGRLAYTNVNVAPKSEREFVQKQAADYIEYADRFLYVESNDSFSGTIMGRFKQVQQMKGLVSAVTPDQLVAARADVLKNIQPVLFAPPKAPTVADLIKIFEFLNKVIPQLQQSPAGQPLIFALTSVFRPEIQLFQMLQQMLAGQGVNLTEVPQMAESTDKAVKDVALQVLAIPLQAGYDQMKKQDPSIELPWAEAMNRRYDKMIADHTQITKDYNRSAEEFDSQIDLLQRLLQILSM